MELVGPEGDAHTSMTQQRCHVAAFPLHLQVMLFGAGHTSVLCEWWLSMYGLAIGGGTVQHSCRAP